MKNYDDVIFGDQNFLAGHQPRKSVFKKIKKEQSFRRFEGEFDELDHHRHAYKRAADKNFTRSQLRADQSAF